MKSERVRIRYDGPALSGHLIDVNYLAPALLALGDICSLANNKFNGDRAAVKVMVHADMEAKCFDLGIELVQTIYEHTKSLIAQDDVKSAKEILEWIGIIVSVGAPFGLIGLYKWLDGRKISEKKLTKQAGRDVTEIHVKGSNNSINVYPQTAELFEETKVLESTQEIVKPLADKGYDSLEFEYNNEVSEKITKNEALEIINIDAEEMNVIETEEEPQEFTAYLKIYSPIFDPDKPKWRFDIGGGNIQTVDISETNIAADALKRGRISVDDIYKVTLEMTQSITKSSQVRNRYKVKKVIKFIPGNRPGQGGLFSDES